MTARILVLGLAALTGALVCVGAEEKGTAGPTGWPFDEAAAKKRQQEAAASLKLTVDKTIELPGGEKLEMILIPPGEFQMGTPTSEIGSDPYAQRNEKQRLARITRPFYLGKLEFTQAQWQALAGANPSGFAKSPDSARRPVESVNYDDIQEKLLPKLQPLAPSGWKFRLPTEAEWEYACRAGAATPFNTGATISDKQAAIGLKESVPCGQFPPNAWGLHDMHGNIIEWCLDWHDADFPAQAPAADPVNLKSGWGRSLRGGGWGSGPAGVRSAWRGPGFPAIRHMPYMSSLGFRIALIPAADQDPVSKAPQAAADAKAPPPELFKDGDSVCFVGDSITRGGGYHTFIRLYYLTRFPDRKIQMSNAGISGDKADQASGRVAWDVAPNKPTVCPIMFGMNDLNKWNRHGKETTKEYRAAILERYQIKTCELTDLLAGLNCRLIYLSASPFDEVVASPTTPLTTDGTNRNKGLAEGAKTLASVAGRMAQYRPASYVDIFTPMNDINTERQKTDKNFTIVGPDRVHPGPVGHFVMAYTFLKAQKAPQVVSRLVLDAPSGKAEASENCEVKELKADAKGAKFQLLEKALPFPVPEAAAPALELVPFTAELNQETLMVKGLEAGDYELLIDKQPVGKFAAATLAAGVNLATNTATPQHQQALKLMKANDERAVVANDILRDLAFVRHCVFKDFKGDWNDASAVMAAIDAAQQKLDKADYGYGKCETFKKYYPKRGEYEQQVAALEAEMLKLSQPIPHQYELRKAQ